MAGRADTDDDEIMAGARALVGYASTPNMLPAIRQNPESILFRRVTKAFRIKGSTESKAFGGAVVQITYPEEGEKDRQPWYKVLYTDGDVADYDLLDIYMILVPEDPTLTIEERKKQLKTRWWRARMAAKGYTDLVKYINDMLTQHQTEQDKAAMRMSDAFSGPTASRPHLLF